ncbi:hypothetical protein Q8W41_25105 [Vibrio splendidus]|uniref:hypothetical protein n=1 Tax=Vibrio splendidus TaxID=29497 RepID=UPI0027354164|nr:hypothetical protein [Vibrio splendidus]MDP2592757.1 hypothetical protein [Vibrio splendidus]
MLTNNVIAIDLAKNVFQVCHINAALSGEQRRPPYLNHCAVNTKAESNRKYQALGIPLKQFVWIITSE